MTGKSKAPLAKRKVRNAPSMPNRHDRFFYKFVTQKDAAAYLARLGLPVEIADALDFSRLELAGTRQVDDDLAEYFSDIAYKVPFAEVGGPEAYLFLLFEHKSSPEPLVALQVLKYMVNQWERIVESGEFQSRGRRLPVILPLVVYHGADPWNISQHFSDLFGKVPPAMAFILQFRFLLLDLSKTKLDRTETTPIVWACARMLQIVFQKDFSAQFPAVLGSLSLEDPAELECIRLAITYAAQTHEFRETELPNMIDTAFPKAKGESLTEIFGRELEELRKRVPQKLVKAAENRGRKKGRQGVKKGKFTSSIVSCAISLRPMHCPRN